MANFKKFDYGTTLKMLRHDFRECGSYSSNVDEERTRENLNGGPTKNYREAVDRLKEYLDVVPHSNRKDLITSVGYVVSCPAILNTKQEQKEFFAIALRDLKDRVGEDKILCSVVHYDEPDCLPHLQCLILPIVETKQNETGYKFSGKEFLSRQFLRN